MREVRVINNCDVCLPDKTEAVFSETIKVGNETHEIDLCSEHVVPVDLFRQMLADFGRPIGVRKKINQNRTRYPIHGETPKICPVCLKGPYKSRGSFQTHFRDQHGQPYGRWLMEQEDGVSGQDRKTYLAEEAGGGVIYVTSS